MATAKNLKVGDKVKWNTPQGETRGTVVKKETSTAKVKGHTAKASASHDTRSAAHGSLNNTAEDGTAKRRRNCPGSSDCVCGGTPLRNEIEQRAQEL